MILKLNKDTAELLEVLSASEGKNMDKLIAEIIDRAGKEHLRNLIISKSIARRLKRI